jgi:hypothetical protein
VDAEVEAQVTPERLYERVKVLSNGCWIFQGATNDSGYGVVRVGGQLWKAHRYSFTVTLGPIPPEFDLGHLCHDADLSCPPGPCFHRKCIRPGHLTPMTIDENRHQAVKKRNERIRERYRV